MELFELFRVEIDEANAKTDRRHLVGDFAC